MQGIIFVTWEKFLGERFGNSFLNVYRNAIGETAATAPLTSKVYDDVSLLAGVKAACQLTGMSSSSILREYGHYFVTNSLTSHLCSYLLTQVHSGRELLIAMRDAHAQMRRTPDALTPPVFSYEVFSDNPNEFALIYDSPRHLCAVLYGAIEGAAERFKERVRIVESSCMKQGASVCRFEVSFQSTRSGQTAQLETPEMQRQRMAQRYLDNIVLESLPYQGGITLNELQRILQKKPISPMYLRPRVVLEALRHLQFAGLIASTSNTPGDELMKRRYWRAPTDWNG